jgi:hypothetical protein
MVLKKKMRPVLDSDFWLIGPQPELKELPLLNKERTGPHEPNDHCIFQAANGMWQLWACVRKTPVGRCLVNWESENLTDSPWKETGRVIRADRSAGESMVDWKGQEFLQSPFVVKDGDTYYMTYGGYSTGKDEAGNPTDDYGRTQNQISLMTSPDGINWTRYRGENGWSRIIVGPGATRDQYLVKFGDTWYMYYTGHDGGSRENERIYVRTSNDLIHWSDCSVAHCIDREYLNSHTCESPTVVERAGYYYLFRSGGLKTEAPFSVGVYRSEDPLDFGTSGDGEDRRVCYFPAHAGEIVFDEDGQEYISRLHNDDPTHYEITLARMHWEPDD